MPCSLKDTEGFFGTFSTSEFFREESAVEPVSSLTEVEAGDFDDVLSGTLIVGCLCPDDAFWPII